MVVIWPGMVKIYSAIGDVRVVMVDVCSAIVDLRVVMVDVWPSIGDMRPAKINKIYFIIFLN